MRNLAARSSDHNPLCADGNLFNALVREDLPEPPNGSRKGDQRSGPTELAGAHQTRSKQGESECQQGGPKGGRWDRHEFRPPVVLSVHFLLALPTLRS